MSATVKSLVWSRRYFYVTAIILVCVAITVFSFDYIRLNQHNQALIEFEHDATAYRDAVSMSFSHYLSRLDSLEAFFKVTPSVSRHQFSDFVVSLLANLEGVQAFEWVPRVLHENRSVYEETAKFHGLPEFEFKEWSASGALIRAKSRLEYYPVYYVEPLSGNRRALGLDLSSNLERKLALLLSRDTGETVLTDRITLVQETGKQYAVLAFKPVYRRDVSRETAANRRAGIRGYVLGVFRIGDVVDNATSALRGRSEFKIEVENNNSPEEIRSLYLSSPQSLDSRTKQVRNEPHKRTLPLALPAANGNWQITISALPDHSIYDQYWAAWFVLVCGFAFTGVLSRSLFYWINQEAVAARLVVERTRSLQESDDRFRQLIEGSVQGVLIHGFFKPLFVNQAYADLLGYETPEEILAQDSAMDHVSSEDRDRMADYAKGRAEGKNAPLSYEFRAVRKDGSIIWLENRVRSIAWKGQPANQRTVVDITERKQMEQMKNEFVSTVSHELRTPLTSIKGSLGLIRTGAVGALPDDVSSMLEIAYTNSDRLVHLINDILDIEKIDAGGLELHPKAIEVSELVENAVKANEGFGDEYEVSFVLKNKLSGNAIVEGDENRLNQVLSNLMSNAAKFSPPGDHVEVSLSEDGLSVRVSVSDNGPGVPPEFQNKIFEKFTQADASDSRQKGGTGLGLSISKAIIEQHGGVLGFVTKSGEGATFYFSLPTIAEVKPFTMPLSRTGNRYRVLIVEDDPEFANLLRMVLQQDGFETVVSSTASEAKTILASTDIDVMTVDIGLPDQDGISFIKELRQESNNRNLPIIIVSSTARQREKSLVGDTIEIVDWIPKPIDFERLKDRIKFAIRRTSTPLPEVLHVEDDKGVAEVVSNLVEEIAHVTSVRTIRGAKQLLKEKKFDLVILDLMLPDGAGEKLLPLININGDTATPVIVFSAIEASKDLSADIKISLLKSRASNDEVLRAVRSAVGAGKE